MDHAEPHCMLLLKALPCISFYMDRSRKEDFRSEADPLDSLWRNSMYIGRTVAVKDLDSKQRTIYILESSALLVCRKRSRVEKEKCSKKANSPYKRGEKTTAKCLHCSLGRLTYVNIFITRARFHEKQYKEYFQSHFIILRNF